MKRYEVEKTTPYNMSRLWGDEKYSLQNMLVRQVNFPLYYYEGDTCWEVWTDRVPDEDHKKAKEFIDSCSDKPMFGYDLMSAVKPEDFLKFCALMAGKGNEPTPTGARVVRYTSARGYPVHRYDLYWRHPDSPMEQGYDGNFAPNVIQPQPRLDLYGYEATRY